MRRIEELTLDEIEQMAIVGAQLLEGDESSAFVIPKHQTQALQASRQRNSTETQKLGIVAQHFGQAIERDPAR